MHPCDLPHTFCTQDQVSFSSSSAHESSILDENMMLLKRPMIETPEKDRRFDPRELLTMELIKTPPPDIEPSSTAFYIAALKDKDGMSYQATSISTSTSDLPMIAKLSVRNRMICHQDFPRLLDLINQLKNTKTTAKQSIEQSTNDSEAIAKGVKERIGVRNFTIFRGQCPITDRMMQGYCQTLQHNLKVSKVKATIIATTDTTCSTHAMAPTRLFSSNIQLNNDDIPVVNKSHQHKLTTSDFISWAEDFSETSSLTDCKLSAQQKELLKKKKSVQKKTNKAKKAKKPRSTAVTRNNVVSDSGAPYMVARTLAKPKLARGKKRRLERSLDSSSLEHKKTRMASPDLPNASLNFKLNKQPQSFEQPKSKVANSFVHQAASLSSPTQTIASDVAIVLTPHPFKNPKLIKGALLPPTEVAVEGDEPLSEITCRSRRSNITFGQTLLSVSAAIPRALLLLDDTRTVFSPELASPSLKIRSSKMGDKKRSNAIVQGMCETSIDRPSLTTIDEVCPCPVPSLQSASNYIAHHAGTSSHGNFSTMVEAKGLVFANDTDKKNCKKEVGSIDTMSPHIMSVSFL